MSLWTDDNNRLQDVPRCKKSPPYCMDCGKSLTALFPYCPFCGKSQTEYRKKDKSPFAQVDRIGLVCDCCGSADPPLKISFGGDLYYYCSEICYRKFGNLDKQIAPANENLFRLRPPRPLRIQETATYLGISYDEVQRVLTMGELKGETDDGGLFFVNHESIMLYVAKYKIPVIPMQDYSLYSVPW